MQSSSAPSHASASPADLDVLFASLKAADRALLDAVEAAGRLAGSGVCERIEGGPVEWAIGMVCRLTGSDRRMVVAAGETLAHLPTLRDLWAGGMVSWGQVRAIVMAVRKLPVAARVHIDERIAASVDAYRGIDAFDPDHLVDAVDQAAAEFRDPRNAERREEQSARANFVAVQQSFDGRVKGWFDYDPVAGAIVINGMDAASPLPQATAEHEPGQPTPRGKQYAEGLVEMASEYLAGNGGLEPQNAGGEEAQPRPGRKRRRARPLVIVHVDVADITRANGGILELNVRGRLSRITSATLDILARDADMQAVLFNGARPLAVSRKLYAENIPADVRLAVRARDMGDRMPGSRSPLGHTELHHFKHREDGGTNDPDNLGAFTRDHHLNRLHALGWKVSLDPPTGAVTIRRGNRAWRSLPRSTGLARPPDTRPSGSASPRTHHGEDSSDALPF